MQMLGYSSRLRHRGEGEWGLCVGKWVSGWVGGWRVGNELSSDTQLNYGAGNIQLLKGVCWLQDPGRVMGVG
jgi:hypothetical protein